MLSRTIRNTANVLAEANAEGADMSMHMRENLVDIMRSWEERAAALEAADLSVGCAQPVPRAPNIVPLHPPKLVGGTDLNPTATPAQETSACRNTTP